LTRLVSECTMETLVVVVNEFGLHARCAAKIARAAQRACGKVMLSRNGETVDATSILDILTLACAKGSRVLLTISDPADGGILEEIAAMMKNGFGE